MASFGLGCEEDVFEGGEGFVLVFREGGREDFEVREANLALFDQELGFGGFVSQRGVKMTCGGMFKVHLPEREAGGDEEMLRRESLAFHAASGELEGRGAMAFAVLLDVGCWGRDWAWWSGRCRGRRQVVPPAVSFRQP